MTFNNTSSEASANVVSINNNDFSSDSDLTNTSCFITLNNYANINLSMYNNEITNHYGDAITIVQNNNSVLNLIVNGNLCETWYSGLDITLNNSSTLTGSIVDNNLAFDAYSGILITSNNSSAVSGLLIDSNYIEGSLVSYSASADAVSFTSGSTAAQSLTISNNNLQAGGNGIGLTVNAASMTAVIENNTFTHNQLFGINLVTNGASVMGNWSVAGNTLVANGASFGSAPIGGASITAEGGSTTNLSFTNNLASPIYPLPTSATGTYQFTNTGSTFNLTSYSGNTGAVTKNF